MSSIASEAMTSEFLRHCLRRGRRAGLRVCGHSMSPLLPAGSRVLLRPLRATEALKGALVAVDCGSKVVVHRVDTIERGLVRTRGLKARSCDRPVRRRQIVGVVCRREGRVPIPEWVMRAVGSLISGVCGGARWVLNR